MDDRQRRRDRALRSYQGWKKHEKTREEKRRIKDARRAAGPRRRRKAARDLDEEPMQESMAPRRADAAAAARKKADLDEVMLEEASVVAVHRTRVVLDLAEEPASASVARGVESLAVGDEVGVSRQADRLVVRVRRPRRSVLLREDPGDAEQAKVLAANVDLGVLVLSLERYRPHFAERVVASLVRGEVRPAICLNKVDTADEARRREARAGLRPLEEQGVAVVECSARTGAGIEELRSMLQGRCAVLVGHSGVGKTSLTNALSPGLGLDTAEVRAGDHKGRHTTTSSSVVRLDATTRLIDTPGVRAFGLGEVFAEDRELAFPDVEGVAAGCRFRDCRHGAEPGCAVRAAVETGRLSGERLEAYRRFRGC